MSKSESIRRENHLDDMESYIKSLSDDELIKNFYHLPMVDHADVESMTRPELVQLLKRDYMDQMIDEIDK